MFEYKTEFIDYKFILMEKSVNATAVNRDLMTKYENIYPLSSLSDNTIIDRGSALMQLIEEQFESGNVDIEVSNNSIQLIFIEKYKHITEKIPMLLSEVKK